MSATEREKRWKRQKRASCGALLDKTMYAFGGIVVCGTSLANGFSGISTKGREGAHFCATIQWHVRI